MKRPISNELVEITTQLQELRGRIGQLQKEEQEGFDNLSERLKQTERGQAMERAAGRIGTAMVTVDQAVKALKEAQA